MRESCAIYVVDGDSAIRGHLFQTLKQQGHRPSSYSLAQDFLDALDFLEFGIILVDLDLPDRSGLAVVEHVRQARPDMLMICMAGDANVRMAVRALKQGASDFIEKPFTDRQIAEIVADACAVLTERIALRQGQVDAASRMDQLTSRELYVMQGLVAGRSNKELARQLNLSPRTIEMHRANMMKKIGARNLIETIRFAIRAGMREEA